VLDSSTAMSSSPSDARVIAKTLAPLNITLDPEDAVLCELSTIPRRQPASGDLSVARTAVFSTAQPYRPASSSSTGEAIFRDDSTIPVLNSATSLTHYCPALAAPEGCRGDLRRRETFRAQRHSSSNRRAYRLVAEGRQPVLFEPQQPQGRASTRAFNRRGLFRRPVDLRNAYGLTAAPPRRARRDGIPRTHQPHPLFRDREAWTRDVGAVLPFAVIDQ